MRPVATLVDGAAVIRDIGGSSGLIAFRGRPKAGII
jgi:hypothetical protein